MTERPPKGHEPHDEEGLAHVPKHLQLGLTPEDVMGDTKNRHFHDDKESQDLIWSDATTVEQYKEDIELLARLAEEASG